jgi:hypothetical protein
VESPHVADGADGFGTWGVVANILNKQLRRADEGLFSSFGVRRGTTQLKNRLVKLKNGLKGHGLSPLLLNFV